MSPGGPGLSDMPEYLRDSYDWSDPDLVAVYDEVPLWSALFGQLLLKHLPLRPGIEILDVGCGTGFPLLELAQRFGPGCRVHGLDPWAAALDRVRRKLHVLKIRNVDVHEGDAAAMPFREAQFDLIVSNLGVNNFEDPKAVLAECWRVAKPSAPMVLTTNLRGHMREFYQMYEATLREFDRPALLEKLQAHVNHRQTIEGVCELLESSRFRITRVCKDRFSLRFVDGSAMLRHSFIKYGFLDGWRGIPDSSEEEEVFRRLEQKLNRLAERKGELALTIPAAYIEAEKIA